MLQVEKTNIDIIQLSEMERYFDEFRGQLAQWQG